MARPRKPTNLHLVTGTFEPSRHAGRREPPVNGAIGDPPASWPQEAREIWTEVVSCIPADCAGHSDRIIVELTTRLLIQMRSKGKFNAAVAAQLRCCLATLGMTPADRSRVSASLAANLDCAKPGLEEFFE
jgi:hypothetical protein